MLLFNSPRFQKETKQYISKHLSSHKRGRPPYWLPLWKFRTLSSSCDRHADIIKK